MTFRNSSRRRVVAAGLMGGFALLGVCSCSRSSNNTDVTGSPTTNVEQTNSPSASPGTAPFSVLHATEGDWAAYSDGYVFSETPQGAGEQYIFETYPDLWDQGVRVLSNKTMPGYNLSDPALPGAVVQYISGVRYEGTVSMPLGFRGQTAAPDALPSDAVNNYLESMRTDAWTEGNAGQGGYVINIAENVDAHRGVEAGISQSNDTTLIVTQFDKQYTGKEIGETMRFADWQSAWAYVQQSNGFSVPGMDRPLYPGEISAVSVFRETVDAHGYTRGGTTWVWDSGANDWVLGK